MTTKSQIAKNNARIALLTQVLALRAENAKLRVAQPVVTYAKAKRETPAWIIARGKNSTARKALFATMPADHTRAEWEAAKLARGIK